MLIEQQCKKVDIMMLFVYLYISSKNIAVLTAKWVGTTGFFDMLRNTQIVVIMLH